MKFSHGSVCSAPDHRRQLTGERVVERRHATPPFGQLEPGDEKLTRILQTGQKLTLFCDTTA
jgi:hypothetical protein